MLRSVLLGFISSFVWQEQRYVKGEVENSSFIEPNATRAHKGSLPIAVKSRLAAS